MPRVTDITESLDPRARPVLVGSIQHPNPPTGNSANASGLESHFSTAVRASAGCPVHSSEWFGSGFQQAQRRAHDVTLHVRGARRAQILASLVGCEQDAWWLHQPGWSAVRGDLDRRDAGLFKAAADQST